MIGYLERLITLYYKVSDWILMVPCIAFIPGAVWILLIGKGERRYIINKLAKSFFPVISLTVIGELLQVLEVIPTIEYVYFTAMIFIMPVCFLVGYMIFQMITYQKVICLILRNAVYLQYLIFMELFLLAATNHLEFREWVAGVAVVLLIQLLPEMLEKWKKRKPEEDEDESREATGYPNPELYHRRSRQLTSFIPILKQQTSEPYAILISGAWGSGKTSFVKALEGKMKEDYFRWICAGSEASVSNVMDDISGKILEVLRENNVYIEHDNLIEGYFRAFSGVLEKHTGLKFMDKLADLCGIKRNVNSKAYLNEKLGELKGTVYLIIDDLDRCDEEYRDKMFKVIRESTTELTKCKTIFLADKEEFVGREEEGQDKRYKDKQYIEKYISYTLDLCKEDYSEILDYYVRKIISNKFLQGLNSVFIKNRSADEIWDMIYQCPAEIQERYRAEYEKTERQVPKKTGNEEQYKAQMEQYEKRKRILEERMTDIEENMTNSRKVKNFLKGIAWDVENLNKGVELCSPEFQKEDWIEAVIEVQFVKNMLPELFDTIKKYRDIVDIRMRHGECNIDALFALKDSAIGREKGEYVYNEIIYHVDVIEFEKAKTAREEYLGELREGRMQIEHINEYVKYAESYGDLENTVKICEEQSFQKEQDRGEYLRNILERMGDQYGWIAEDRKEFLKLSKRLTGYLRRDGVSERERTLCGQEGNIIAQRLIAANAWRFQFVLSFLFPTERVETVWHMRQPSNIHDLYIAMEGIDMQNKFSGLHNSDKMKGVTDYCKSLEKELKQEKYRESGIDFEKVFAEINLVLESCQFWREIDKNLEQINEESLPLFKDYFSSNGAVYDDTVFESVETLVQALEVLKQFYREKAGDYQSKFSKILAGICYKAVMHYERDQEWFAGREGEVRDLLAELAGMVYELDQAADIYDQQTLDQIRLYLYKFKERYQS